jgi:hypothetical protein
VKFTDDILQCIVQFGQDGYSTKKIAAEYGMTSIQLKNECDKNQKLKKAVEDADYNYKMFKKDELESNPTSEIKKIMYENIIREIGGTQDNRIEIEEV